MSLLSAALLLLLQSASPPAAAIRTELCALVANPAAFAGRRVTFDADLLTDWHHGIVLADSNCKGGVELTSTDAVSAAENAALDDAVGTPLTGYNRTARATFTGTFNWKPARTGRPTYFYNARQFTAENVTNVSVRQH